MLDRELNRVPVVVTLPAQIDLISQDRPYDLVHAALAGAAATVIADLTATTFCDCASLRRLVAIQHHAASRGRELRLVIPPDSPLHRTAELMDLDHLLPVFGNLREAAAAVPLPRPPAPRPARPASGGAPWPTSAM